MSQNKQSKSPVKSFRVNSYNNKKLKEFKKEFDISATELINGLLESYFMQNEKIDSLELSERI